MRLWCRHYRPNKEIFRFSNANGDIITVVYCVDDTQCWFEMRAWHSGDTWAYTVESQHITLPENTEQLFTWLRRVDNLYELKIENRGVEV